MQKQKLAMEKEMKRQEEELLKILACPNCRTPVSLVKSGQGLKCQECHRVYPVKDGIPVMLIDEASIES